MGSSAPRPGKQLLAVDLLSPGPSHPQAPLDASKKEDNTVVKAVHESQQAHGLRVVDVIGPVAWSHLASRTGETF
jgi:hypothetical protein